MGREITENVRLSDLVAALRQCFPTPAEARLAVFDFIEGWYNSRRRHSALNYLAPIAYEQRERSLVRLRKR